MGFGRRPEVFVLHVVGTSSLRVYALFYFTKTWFFYILRCDFVRSVCLVPTSFTC